MNLSPNFSLDELTRSSTATRQGIEEQFNPDQAVINNLKDLCIHVLEPLQDALKLGELSVTSGYRCPALNKVIGGSNTSQHTFGQAADLQFKVNGKMDNIQIAKKILDRGIPFDQLIVEFGTMEKPSWIHVSYNYEKLRGQILRADNSTGKTIYTTLTKAQITGI
jgi:zinc D-Ala-D-Ala carboxypeptidase